MAAPKSGGSGYCLSYGEHRGRVWEYIYIFSVPVWNDTYLTHLNNKNNNNHPIATATTISVLAIVIILVSTSIVTPAAASPTTTTTTARNTTTTTSSEPSSGIEVSSQPIYQKHTPPANVSPINQTHVAATHSGNGTLTLPNSTQTIKTSVINGSAVVS